MNEKKFALIFDEAKNSKGKINLTDKEKELLRKARTYKRFSISKGVLIDEM